MTVTKNSGEAAQSACESCSMIVRVSATSSPSLVTVSCTVGDKLPELPTSFCRQALPALEEIPQLLIFLVTLHDRLLPGIFQHELVGLQQHFF